MSTPCDIKNDILDTRIFCGRYFPFIVIPLSYTRIITSKEVPTAGVDETGTIAINPDWWNTLNMESKRFTLIHECLHLVLCHPFRAQQFNHETYNICADGKVNHAITQAQLTGITYQNNNLVTLNSIATITNLHIDDLDKMSTEEIVKNLTQNQTNPNKQHLSKGALFSGDLIKRHPKGEVIQNGEKVLYSSHTSETHVESWKGLCEKAKTFAKQSGTLPAALERVIAEVLEVKPPWQTTLRFGLRNNSCVDSSFAYTNRRSDDLPGHTGHTGTVWCLVDTSGSISQDTLRYFLGLIKHETRNASIRVIAWDAKSYEVLKAEHPNEVARKIAAKLKGGGGTVCLPVLQQVHKLMGMGDSVILLTDGDIFDANNPETQQWFKKVANKAGFALIGYTHKPLQAPNFNKAHITLNQQPSR